MQNNSDKFDHLISLSAMKCAEEEAKELQDLDTSGVVLDPSYYRKRNKIIHKCRRASFLKVTKSVTLRVAVAIMIMVMLSCALIGCVPGLRKVIFDAIIKWYESYVTVSYDSQDGEEMETGYEEESTTQPDTALVAPMYIEKVRKPTDLPEGAWEDILAKNSTTIYIDYYCNEDYLFSFVQMLLKPKDNFLDSEDVAVTHIKINDNDAMVVESINGREISIIWCDEEYSYCITSIACDLETLIQYAKSVK